MHLWSCKFKITLHWLIFSAFRIQLSSFHFIILVSRIRTSAIIIFHQRQEILHFHWLMFSLWSLIWHTFVQFTLRGILGAFFVYSFQLHQFVFHFFLSKWGDFRWNYFEFTQTLSTYCAVFYWNDHTPYNLVWKRF